MVTITEILELFDDLDMDKQYFDERALELYGLLLLQYPKTLQPTLSNIAFARIEYMQQEDVKIQVRELGLVAIAACFLTPQGCKEDLKPAADRIYDYFVEDIQTNRRLVSYAENFDKYYYKDELTEEQNIIFNNIIAGTIESLKTSFKETRVHTCKLQYFMGGNQHTIINRETDNDNNTILNADGVCCMCDYCENTIYTNTWGCASCDFDLCNDCMSSLLS